MAKSFSFEDRTRSLIQMRQDHYDLIIIGGGINGAGIARDACSRGMRVALVEANDYASGTSSRSSKLIHGGIRYLENLEFHLVFEALSERAKLFKMAPHLVHPLRFLIPIFKDSRVGYHKMKLGMWLYDLLALLDVPEMHESLGFDELVAQYPFLKSEALEGGLRYSDAYMDDDRLVFETLRSAHNTGLLNCANYTKANGVTRSPDGKVDGIRVTESLLGESFEIKGSQVISTVGPWTDELRGLVTANAKPVLRPTKGVHLTFERSRFPLVSAVVMGVQDRIVFAIPRNDMVIVGTTDTDYPTSPGRVVATAEDVSYLLDVANQYFPAAKLRVEDIVASYAGVRPLVQDGSASEGKTSREHTIWTEDSGVTYVAGGKYTTYRLIAQQATEHVLKFYPIAQQVAWQRADTEAPLNPLVTHDFLSERQELAEELLEQMSMVTQQEAEKLIDRFGPEALYFVERFGQKSYLEYEAMYAIWFTSCMSLRDFYFRRAPLFLSLPDHGFGVAKNLAELWEQELSLTPEQVAHQLEQLRTQVDFELGWKKDFQD